MIKKLLNYEIHKVSNQADWLICLHGAGGSIATWKYQKQFFKNYYNLLLIDLRDHGESNVAPLEAYSFKLITADIFQVIQTEGIKEAHFMTLSFGSVLLQHFSMQYPQFVKSAIFAGGIFKPNLSIKAFVFLARILNIFLPYSWMYSLFSYLLMPKKHHQKSRNIYQKQAAKLSKKAYMKWVGLYTEFFILLSSFYNQEIIFPSLVVMGAEDYVFLKSAKEFSTKNEGIYFKKVSGAGHICNIDKPHEFNTIVLEFLKG